MANTYVIEETFQHTPSSAVHRTLIPGAYSQRDAEEKADRLSTAHGPKRTFLAREGTDDELLREWAAAAASAKAASKWKGTG